MGGIAYLSDSSVFSVNNTLAHASANEGAGIYMQDLCSLFIINDEWRNNTASSAGGMLFVLMSSCSFTSVIQELSTHRLLQQYA
jgi:hypothetical protein